MISYLIKNGEAFCALIPSAAHPLPLVREECWHDCVLVAERRVDARSNDVLEIWGAADRSIPFEISKCRIGNEGWELEGKLLF